MPSSPASSCLPKPLRPERHYREFTPINQASALISNVTTDQTCFSTCCSECNQIREWYSNNLAEVQAWTTLHGDEELKHVIQHYPTVEKLVASSRQGCHMCTIMVERLLARIKDGYPDGGSGINRIDALLRQLDGPGPVTVLIHISPKRYGTRDNLYANIIPRVQTSKGLFVGTTVLPMLASRASLPYLASGGGMPLYTSSNMCLGLVKDWLDRCVKTHTACGTSATLSFPTRLLFVSYDGPNIKFRLVKTETIPVETDLRYVALSYCWGSSSSVKLTTNTEESLTQGVDSACLPQTIQDALRVTLDLGLSWIWVDSLCIIQDSTSDWTREASRMCDVYLGSTLCIAARGAQSNAEGLFAVRDPLRQSPCVLVDRTGRADGDDSYVVAAWPPLQAARPWPLESRGWVLQERALPPRTVKFGSYVCWECRECATDEFGLEASTRFPALPGAHERIVRQFYETVVGKQQLRGGGGVDEHAVLGMWRTLVEEYSTTSLSFISDRYTAINGLVSAVRQSLGWAPKWGLWQEHMFDGLCWSVTAESEVGRTGVGPTWSWLSVDGPVAHFGPSDYTELALVLADGLDGHIGIPPTSLRDKAIKITARPLHLQGSMDADHGWHAYGLPAEWTHVETLSANKKLHWRLDLRDQHAYNMADCLFLPLKAAKKGLLIEGIIITPSPAGEGLFERCGEWEAIWRKEDPESRDKYRAAVDVIMRLPEQTVMVI